MSRPASEQQFVTLSLGDEVFAIPVAYVREILEFRAPFAIPEGPAFMLGLTDVRGQGVPTLDLRRKLGLAPVAPGPAPGSWSWTCRWAIGFCPWAWWPIG